MASELVSTLNVRAQFRDESAPVYRCNDATCAFVCQRKADLERHCALTLHNLWAEGLGEKIAVPSGLEEGVEQAFVSLVAKRTMFHTPTKLLAAGNVSRADVPNDLPLRVCEVMLPPPPQYRCYECARIFRTLRKLQAHMQSENHCRTQCYECMLAGREFLFDMDPSSPASIRNHAKEMRAAAIAKGDRTHIPHVAVIGVIRTVDSVTIVRGEKAPTMPVQFQCPYCVDLPQATVVAAAASASPPPSAPASPPPRRRVMFRDQVCLADHILARHPDAPLAETLRASSSRGAPATCLNCPSVQFGSIAEAAAHQVETQHLSLLNVPTVSPANRLDEYDPVKHAAAKNMFGYQCHECFRVEFTREGLLRHLKTTGHTMPFCAQCGVQLGPDPESVKLHKATTGHTKMFGGFLLPYHYVVAIDATDLDVALLLDEDAERADPLWDLNAVRMVYQCPQEACLKVFMTPEELGDHLEITKHGCIKCEVCEQMLHTWEGHIGAHAATSRHRNELSAVNPLYRKEHIDDFIVYFSEQQLAAHFPSSMTTCEVCQMVVATQMMDVHRRQECLLRKNIRHAMGPNATEEAKAKLPKITHVNAYSNMNPKTEHVDASALRATLREGRGISSSAVTAAKLLEPPATVRAKVVVPSVDSAAGDASPDTASPAAKAAVYETVDDGGDVTVPQEHPRLAVEEHQTEEITPAL